MSTPGVISRIRIGAITDVGLTREQNEDSYLVLLRPGATSTSESDVEADLAEGDAPILAVCDGMGGAAAGEMASRVSVETVRDRTLDVDYQQISDVSELLDWMVETVTEANWLVRNRGALNPALHGMGSTMTIAAIYAGVLALTHVGDSRIYLVRDGGIRQLTEDHTLTSRLVAEGALTAEQAKHHSDRHVLIQAIGTQDDVRAQRGWVGLQPGDRILLCSDGLYELADDARLYELLSGHDSPIEAAKALIREANQNGGHDNVTAVVAHVS